VLPPPLAFPSVSNDSSPAGYCYGIGGSDDSGFLLQDNNCLVFLQGGGGALMSNHASSERASITT